MKTEQKANVEQKLSVVKQSYTQLKASDEEFSRFVKIIHQPWYTTPAEAIFTEGIVESLATLTAGLIQLHTSLINGANAVREVKAVSQH
jgi:hypothetical protein